MDIDSRSPSPGRQDIEQGQFTDVGENLSTPQLTGEGPFTIEAATRMYQGQGTRNRSPTPPRALFRSTTGKGVAFTSEDVAFLCKFMAYRKSVLFQGRIAVSRLTYHYSVDFKVG